MDYILLIMRDKINSSPKKISMYPRVKFLGMHTKSFRKYGNTPYQIIVVHGGPGAAGTLKPLARELAINHGIIEILLLTDTLEGHINELKAVIQKNADAPVILIGHSYGAILSFIFSAKHPSYVKKLIMVCSGVFDTKYAENIMQARLSRLSDEDQSKFRSLIGKLNTENQDTEDDFHSLGGIIEKADAFDPMELTKHEAFPNQRNIYFRVWPQVEELRKSGELLALGNNIESPVIVIHGNYDPHPFEGIKKPLSTVLKKPVFFLLDKCGHAPWVERQAKSRFFALLNREIKD